MASSKPKAAKRGDGRTVAVVTGASRGIGAAVALELARAGCCVVVTSTRKGGTRNVAREISNLPDGLAHELVYHGESRASADALVEATLAEVGVPRVLVNNAGIVRRASLDETTDDDFDEVLKVNLSGPFYLCRRFIPQMSKWQRGGTVVNVSSISATVGNPRSIGYCASKWGLDGMMKSLAAAFNTTGIRVLSVLPGSVDTEMLEGSGFEPQMKPSDVARVVRFLALEAPDALNGSRVELFG